MIHLFSDKIEEVLEKHNVVVSDFENLKEDLTKLFVDSQLTIANKRTYTPKALKEFLKGKGFTDKDATNFFKAFMEWVRETEDGAKWFCSTLDITREILTSDFAIEYFKNNGQKIKLKPKNIVIYHRKK